MREEILRSRVELDREPVPLRAHLVPTTTPDDRRESDTESFHARERDKDKDRDKDRRSSRTTRRTRSVSPYTYTKSIIAHSRRAIGSCTFPGQNYTDLAEWLLLPTPPHTIKHTHYLIVLHTLGVQGPDRTLYLPSDDPHALQRLPRPDSSKSGQVLFIRGHLTADWVSVLGARYHVDPAFFNHHLRFLSRALPGAIFNRRTLPSFSENIMRLRVSTILHQNDLRIHRREENIREQRRRETDAMEVYLRQFPIQGSCGDSVVRDYATLDSEFSILEQEISIFLHRKDEGWIAIVWSDIGRDLASGFAGPWTPGAKDHTLTLHPLPVYQYHPKMTLRQTTIERVISSDHPMSGYAHQARIPQTTALLPFDFDTFLDDDIAKNNPIYALTNLFQHALCSELQVIGLLEWQIWREMDLVGGSFRPYKPRNDHPLDNLLFLRNVLDARIGYIREALRTLKSPSNEIWLLRENGNPVSSRMNRLVEDHESLLTTALELDRQCSDSIGIMMNRAVISESHKAIKQAERMKKLTMLASFFIPLSFASSLFGMNFREFGQGDLSIWLFAVVTTPILGLSYLFYAYDMAEVYRTGIRKISQVRSAYTGGESS